MQDVKADNYTTKSTTNSSYDSLYYYFLLSSYMNMQVIFKTKKTGFVIIIPGVVTFLIDIQCANFGNVYIVDDDDTFYDKWDAIK